MNHLKRAASALITVAALGALWAERPAYAAPLVAGERPKSASLTAVATSTAAKSTAAEENAAATKTDDQASPSEDEVPVENRTANVHADRTYVYIGARYRGNLLPAFMLSPFLKETGSFYLNSLGVEAEFRTNRMSIIPSLSFAEYSTGGSVLVVEAGKPESVTGNWSVINSSLKSLSAQVDFLWSKPVAKNLEYEFGFGASLAVVFDTLQINWVYENANGDYRNASGKGYSLCQPGDDVGNRRGCSRADHNNSKLTKLIGFEEPSWFNGGSKPNFLPNLSLQLAGLRFTPAPQVALRAAAGISLSGLWFGISGSYGLSKPLPRKAPTPNKPSEVESEETYQ
jgi:hypothetical protein